MVLDSSLVTRHSSPSFRAPPPLALYVHLPWCVRKCPYCDFNSHEARAAVPEERYVAALVADLDQALPQVWGRRIVSVFLGGGTPSLFSGRAIDALLCAVRARLPLAPDAEVTLEANPGTAEAEKFRAFRQAGVNRLSIGVQSFNPRHLRTLGRIHDAAEARRAVEIARESFDNFNLDLMHGLPGQTLEEARADIAEAVEHAPAHISAYQLTIEPNTYFHRYPPRLPDDDSIEAMQQVIGATLAAAGYEHYEVSAFARLGEERGARSEEKEYFGQAAEARLLTPHPSLLTRRRWRCAHNLNYWTFGDYLGIGAGAHSKLSFHDRIVREARVKHPGRYMDGAERGNPVGERHEVEAREVGFEFMMNALRLTGGFPLRLFEERAGVPLNAVLRELEEAERRGLLLRDHAHIAPTALGRRFLNDLLQLFLVPAERKFNETADERR